MKDHAVRSLALLLACDRIHVLQHANRSKGGARSARSLFALPLLAAVAGLAACGGGGGGDSPPPAQQQQPPPTAGAPALLAASPAWSAFAPDKIDKSEEGIEREDPAETPTIEDFTVVGDDGPKMLTCTTRSVDFYKTPAEYAMFAPPTTVLYPGALVQGKSLRDGGSANDIKPLNVPERNPVTISIPACLTNDATRTVPATLDAVNQARSSIVASAIAQNATCVSPRGSLQTESYRNDVHKALAVGISGRYFGFTAAADTRLAKNKTDNALSVTFREQMYTVQYTAPRPENVFTPEFTAARYQQLVNNGEVGPDNPPVYVSEVTYGRIMNFSMVSSASETEMDAAVRAAYGVAGAPGSVKGKISTEYEELLETSSYSVAYVGGSTAATSAMMKNLSWGDYFSAPVTAADAVPISFTLRNLKDDSVALVQELTSYDLTTCVEKMADNATFTFLPEQSFAPGFLVPGTVLARFGDVDGGNGDDLVLATTGAGGRGRFRVALSNGDGTFAAAIAGEHPGLVLETGEFQLELGDVDGDGRDDLIFNARENNVGNFVYVAFYKDNAGGGSPGFVYSAEQNMGGPGAWHAYPMRVAQMDGVRGIDLVWNNTPISTQTNTTYIAHSVNTAAPGIGLTTSPLFVRTGSLNHFITNFSDYDYTHIADFDGDGRADIVWQDIDADGNAYYIARGTATGLNLGGTQTNNQNRRNFGGSWGVYSALAGDVTGGGKTDLVQPRARCPFNQDNGSACTFGIYLTQGSSSSDKAFTDAHVFQSRNLATDAAIADLIGRALVHVEPEFLLGDVDGDGRQDLIINDKSKSSALVNKIGVGLGTANGEFSFARAAQDIGVSRNWSNHQTIVADVDGDGRDDVVWVNPGSTTSVYVGTARAD